MDDEDYLNNAEIVEEFDQSPEDMMEGEMEFDHTNSLVKEQKTLQYLFTHHPETKLLYVEQVMEKLPLVSYPPENDATHKSQPRLTLYEKTKIIGFRANQLAQGARAFINVPPYVTDVAEIARMELDQKRLPFIIARPMPDGSFEYWRLTDLMIV